MSNRYFLPIVILFCSVALSATPIYVINPEHEEQLAFLSPRYDTQLASIENLPEPPAILILEADKQAQPQIGLAEAKAIDQFIRAGGSLLLAIGREPGLEGYQLAASLPATLLRTTQPEPLRGPAGVSWHDPDFFSSDKVETLSFPHFFEVRPIDSTERAAARTEQFGTGAPRLNPGETIKGMDLVNVLSLPENSHWWTKQLWNRDAKVRLRANDFARTPLLITGLNGAGRVALLNTGLNLVSGDTSEVLFENILDWLNMTEVIATSAVESIPPPIVTVDNAGRSLRLDFYNPSDIRIRGETIVRLLTWERAPFKDLVEFVDLPAEGSASVYFEFPVPDGTSFQALSDQDAYVARIGLLDHTNGKLLSSTEQWIDLTPVTTVEIHTQDLRGNHAYGKASPVENDHGLMLRMGYPLSSYIFKPGTLLKADVTLNHGLHNLAPLAELTDNQTPENPSLHAINDEAAGAHTKPFQIQGYGYYEQAADTPVSLTFQFPSSVYIAGMRVIATPAMDRESGKNPKSIHLTAVDAKTIAEQPLEFGGSHEGYADISFNPVLSDKLTVCFPATKNGIKLAEIEILGSHSSVQPVKGQLTAKVVDVAKGNTLKEWSEAVELAPYTRQNLQLEVAIPPQPELQAVRIDASFTGDQVGAEDTLPVLAIMADDPVRLEIDQDPSIYSVQGMIVSKGFRQMVPMGTHTAITETMNYWSMPDDEIWAYMRGFKENPNRNGTNYEADIHQLYVTGSNMRHMIMPWRAYYNGDEFFPTHARDFVEKIAQKHDGFDKTDTIFASFSDRWGAGPRLSNTGDWQDYEQFHQHLLSIGKAGLRSKTLPDLFAETRGQFGMEWQKWQMNRYLSALEALKVAFAERGKTFIYKAQGTPTLPLSKANIVYELLQGSNDDSTWDMAENNMPRTTGRQLAAISLVPYNVMSTLFGWGFNSNHLVNWYMNWQTAATTEPSRRHQYDRAFRGIVRMDGSYDPMSTYGYGRSAQIAPGFSIHDYTQWHQVMERYTYLTPDAPFGAGLIISTAHYEEDENFTFIGSPGGGARDAPEKKTFSESFGYLHEAGFNISFATNSAALPSWQEQAPIILINPEQLSTSEIEHLKSRHAAGNALIAIIASDMSLPTTLAPLFGLDQGWDAPAASRTGPSQETAHIIKHAGNLLIRLAGEIISPQEAAALTSAAIEYGILPTRFAPGTAGYGFIACGQRLLVIEDWMEVGRESWVQIRKSALPGKFSAVNLNDHTALPVEDDGEWWTIHTQVRPGDALLILLNDEL